MGCEKNRCHVGWTSILLKKSISNATSLVQLQAEVATFFLEAVNMTLWFQMVYWMAVLLTQSAITLIFYFILFNNYKIYLMRPIINWHVIKNIYFTSEALETTFLFGCLSSLVTCHIWSNWLDIVDISRFFQIQATLPLEMLL